MEANTPPPSPPQNEMTLDEFVAWCRANQAQDENDLDRIHLRENMRLTPAERLEKHEVARRAVWEIQGARRRKTAPLDRPEPA